MIPLYVGSVTGYSGKHFVSIGVGLMLQAQGLKIGHFKPYGLAPGRRDDAIIDRDAQFFCDVLGLDDNPEDVCPQVITEHVLSHILANGPQDRSKEILDAFQKVSRNKDVVIVGGVSCMCCGPIVGLTEKDFIQKTGARVILAAKLEEIVLTLDRLLAIKCQFGDSFKGVILNRVPESRLDYADKLVRPFLETQGIAVYGIIRNDPVLGAVPVSDIVDEFGGTVLTGEDKMSDLVERFMIGAMNVSSALKHFRKQRNKGVITGGDRSDIQLAALETSTRCLILTGDMYPNAAIITKAEETGVPIVVVPYDTAEAVEKCENLMGHLSLRAPGKIEQVKNVFAAAVDWERLKVDCGI